MPLARDRELPALSVELPQTAHGIAVALDAARDLAALAGMTSAPARRLRLVVEELVTNCVAHGAAPPGSVVRLSLAVAAEGILIEMEDSGRSFDPRCDRPADPRNTPADERPPGGLGWPLILTYSRVEAWQRDAERNRLRLLFHGKSQTRAG